MESKSSSSRPVSHADMSWTDGQEPKGQKTVPRKNICFGANYFIEFTGGRGYFSMAEAFLWLTSNFGRKKPQT